MITIADSAKISELADIEDSIRGTAIEIEEHVVIESFVKIKPAGGSGDVRIGKGSTVNSGVVIYTGNGLDIGRDVLIAANCTFAPTNHDFRKRDIKISEQGFQPSRGGILVEDDVWIGANCVILDGARLLEGCVIGAGSIVSGEIPAYSVNAGNPLRQIGRRA
jgi:acetyltransferase-like isoleucine patch superfamily enzyme|tara:strand:+ start:3322 stop:3810 length:489 start_codon:yes stop_codon:yes gene_type:complete